MVSLFFSQQWNIMFGFHVCISSLLCFSEEDFTGEEEMPSFRGGGPHTRTTHTSLTATNNGVCISLCGYVHRWHTVYTCMTFKKKFSSQSVTTIDTVMLHRFPFAMFMWILAQIQPFTCSSICCCSRSKQRRLPEVPAEPLSPAGRQSPLWICCIPHHYCGSAGITRWAQLDFFNSAFYSQWILSQIGTTESPHRDANPQKVGCGQRSKQQFSTVLWFVRQFNWLMPTLCIKSER